MNAVVQSGPALLGPFGMQWLAAVLQIEQASYGFPWSSGNFTDALRAGYQAQVLTMNSALLGYFVAMQGVDEAHLLNIAVAPNYRRQGWAAVMLDALKSWARDQGARCVWLEVRQSNHAAWMLYQRHGFVCMGQRKNYYPAADNQREDAVVMNYRL